MHFLSSASGAKRRDEGLVVWQVLDGLGGRGEKLAKTRPDLRLEKGRRDETTLQITRGEGEEEGNSNQQEIKITSRAKRGTSGDFKEGKEERGRIGGTCFLMKAE